MPKLINKTLSVRISLMVVFAMAILLMASMAVMLHYSRKAVKEEALHKASQTLDGITERIDNILLSVEQSTGNIYYNLITHLDRPDMMFTYSRKIVETNPYISGCAIAFKENYYEGREYSMAYVYRTDNGDLATSDSSIIQPEIFGDRPYTEQVWFTEPMSKQRATWLNTIKGMQANVKPLITFCLPIPGTDGNTIGVIGVDVSLSLLSEIVAEAKLSPNSYCTLLEHDGTFIVHPDSTKLSSKSVFAQFENGGDPSGIEAAKAMISGETGYNSFRMNGTDYYVFFKPFKRSTLPLRHVDELGWSAGIVYPEDDIFGDYKSLSYYVIVIAIIGLLTMFLLSRAFIHIKLKPLLMLTEKAQLIAKGHYDEPIPDSHQEDEIGRLQDNFQKMQRALSTHIGELEQLKTMLQERGEGLRNAYNQTKKADRMKTAFLHNMTNQMLAPAESIDEDVNTLCKLNYDAMKAEGSQLADDIQHKSHDITELLNNLINISDEDIRKEAEDD